MISLVIQDHFKSIILRFVYYETLVTSMKSLGVREPVISYDDLKVQELSCFMTLAVCEISKSTNKYSVSKKTEFCQIEHFEILLQVGEKYSANAQFGKTQFF